MSRHGAHLIWQPPSQRAELLARAESEPAHTAGLKARSMMAARWSPPVESSLGELDAPASWGEALG